MLTETSFLELIRETGGFEVTLGFRGDVDHFIGGKENKLWYFVQKKTGEDCYVCTLEGETRTDTRYTRKKKALTAKPAPAGKTLKLILAELSKGQEEAEKSGKKPVPTELCGHPCSHYSFSFGERACKIADGFGVTVEYSDLQKEEAGFRLRNIKTGEAVSAPKEA